MGKNCARGLEYGTRTLDLRVRTSWQVEKGILDGKKGDMVTSEHHEPTKFYHVAILQTNRTSTDMVPR